MDEFHFVRDGRLEVYLSIGDGQMRRIGIRTGGTFLNVEGFWLAQPSDHIVRATERTRLWVLNRESMRDMEREAPELAIQVRDSVLRHTLTTDMRLRRRLVAFAKEEPQKQTSKSLQSWRPNFTTAVCSIPQALDEMVDQDTEAVCPRPISCNPPHLVARWVRLSVPPDKVPLLHNFMGPAAVPKRRGILKSLTRVLGPALLPCVSVRRCLGFDSLGSDLLFGTAQGSEFGCRFGRCRGIPGAAGLRGCGPFSEGEGGSIW